MDFSKRGDEPAAARQSGEELTTLNSFDPQEMALLVKVVDQAFVQICGCDEATKAVIAARVLKAGGRGRRDTLLSVALYGSPRGTEHHAAPARFTPSNDNALRLNSDTPHLMSMPARARAIARQCGSEHIAELLELHARLCERNLEVSSREGYCVGAWRIDGV
jgi:hypothetical protein